MDKSVLLIKYLEGYDLIIETINQLPKEVFDYKPSKNKWSIREILVHVTDSEVNSYVRMRIAIAENEAAITAYDQDKWADSLFYQEQDFFENLELFKLIRKNTYNILTKLPSNVWDNFNVHPERGKLSVSDYLAESVDHVNIHIKQILKNYDAWKNR